MYAGELKRQLNEAGFKGAAIYARAFSNSHLFDAIVVYINTHEIIKNYDYVAVCCGKLRVTEKKTSTGICSCVPEKDEAGEGKQRDTTTPKWW